MTVEHHKSDRAPFSLFGRISMRDSTVVGNDLFDLILEMSGLARKLFVDTVRNASYKTNIGYLPFDKTPYIDATNRSRYITELVKLGLIKKIPVSLGSKLKMSVAKHSYIINPDIIQPPTGYYEKALKVWNMI